MKKVFCILTFLFLTAIIPLISCKKELSCEDCFPNEPPIALAGPDITITLPVDTVLLDGSKSHDRDGSITKWQWQKISGPPSFFIVEPGVAKTIVRALVQGVYVFELKVTDNKSASAIDTLQVIVNAAALVNKPPLANAGRDQSITLPANSVQLDASGSTDPENNISGYLWKKVAGPLSFVITNPTAVKTQVTNLTEGVYQFELTVTDNGGLTARDTVQITVLPMQNNNPGNVYVAGEEVNGTRGGAILWVNGVAQHIGNVQYNSSANSVFVSGSDVYLAGWETSGKNGHYVATLWKNGVAQQLYSDGQHGEFANSVFIAGADVYVTGNEYKDDMAHDWNSATLWKNGSVQHLSDGLNETRANSVFVSGTDIYVAGGSSSGAILWKNGMPQQLPGYEANSVFVSGSDVYVTGSDHNANQWFATLWKNGRTQHLSNGQHNAWGNSVFVSGSDVYVAGVEYSASGTPVATLWKNGLAQKLSDGQHDASAYSVYVFGSDVYVAGADNSGAILWKNGVSQRLSGFYSYSVFVK